MGKVTPRIAIVHDFLLTYGGAERVVSQLHAMYPNAPIYTLLANPKLLKTHFPKATIYTSPLNRSWLRSRPQLLLTRMPQAVESFDLTEYDVVISSSGAFSHGVITGPDTTHICYCHSPMRYAWDWHSEYLTEKGLVGLPRFVAETILSRIRIWDTLAAMRVDIWLANSNTVQKRIQKYYNAPSTVVYPPVNTTFFNASMVTSNTDDQYAVTVSRLTSNKRIDLIIQACIAQNLPLHVIGGGEDRKRLESITGGNELITFTGPLSEEDKRREIANAYCFIFAAEDDFGIAPVEALALGVPVIAFEGGGALETVIDGKNGLFFKDASVESIQKALTRFREVGITLSATQIRETALRFTQEAFTDQIAKIVGNV